MCIHTHRYTFFYGEVEVPNKKQRIFFKAFLYIAIYFLSADVMRNAKPTYKIIVLAFV